jgi:hypothetical protein
VAPSVKNKGGSRAFTAWHKLRRGRSPVAVAQRQLKLNGQRVMSRTGMWRFERINVFASINADKRRPSPPPVGAGRCAKTGGSPDAKCAVNIRFRETELLGTLKARARSQRSLDGRCRRQFHASIAPDTTLLVYAWEHSP